MTETEKTKYVCGCPSSIVWLAVGALLAVSGLTSVLYAANVLADIEIKMVSATMVTLLGLFIVAMMIRRQTSNYKRN